MVVSPGKAKGQVVITNEENLTTVIFNEGDILVCDVTDVRYLSLMRKAGAIVTNRGGVLSHAAIVSRELKKACLVGVKNVIQLLKTGDMVEVDATLGIVKRL
jgi:phosphoenolpyruvate synthase/pyruvate phosphate dikinase